MFHMQRQRRLPEEHARFYAAEICLALNFLHEKGTSLSFVTLLVVNEHVCDYYTCSQYGMCDDDKCIVYISTVENVVPKFQFTG